mmetsp:Transcript_32971/g.81970  ORF Transcript_32971/g.81970 Transcript_32971/m.81970 type:complete len:220 (+) Transcript_32971:357-1016(+)
MAVASQHPRAMRARDRGPLRQLVVALVLPLGALGLIVVLLVLDLCVREPVHRAGLLAHHATRARHLHPRGRVGDELRHHLLHEQHEVLHHNRKDEDLEIGPLAPGDGEVGVVRLGREVENAAVGEDRDHGHRLENRLHRANVLRAHVARPLHQVVDLERVRTLLDQVVEPAHNGANGEGDSENRHVAELDCHLDVLNVRAREADKRRLPHNLDLELVHV